MIYTKKWWIVSLRTCSLMCSDTKITSTTITNKRWCPTGETNTIINLINSDPTLSLITISSSIRGHLLKWLMFRLILIIKWTTTSLKRLTLSSKTFHQKIHSNKCSPMLSPLKCTPKIFKNLDLLSKFNIHLSTNNSNNNNNYINQCPNSHLLLNNTLSNLILKPSWLSLWINL